MRDLQVQINIGIENFLLSESPYETILLFIDLGSSLFQENHFHQPLLEMLELIRRESHRVRSVQQSVVTLLPLTNFLYYFSKSTLTNHY